MRGYAELGAEAAVRDQMDTAEGEEADVPVQVQFHTRARRNAEIHFAPGMSGPAFVIVIAVDACFKACLRKVFSVSTMG